jgi:alkanesulfonate monooxygenase SsuD/methylene tetrahydromethanopterin reductase-like flavin-dependent oxidoreductase (luciferase family)
LLAGERGYGGRTVKVDRFRLAGGSDEPIGLYIGALGPQMLRLAGAVADGVCLNLGTAAATSRQLEEVRAGALRAGRELPETFGVMARFHVVMTDDLGQGRDLIRAGFGPYFAQPVYNRFLAWMGYPEEAAAISGAFAAGDRAAVAAALGDEIIDAITLVGPAQRIRDRLAEYEAAGIGVAALSFLGVDSTGVAATLQALAP